MKYLHIVLATIALAVAVPGSASAAPVTVNLRIEGPTSTLFEGPVTTDVRPFAFTSGSDTSSHQCDGTTTGGTSPNAVPTRGAAVIASGVSTSGTWNVDFGPSFNTVNGVSVAYDAGSGKYLAEYKNDALSDVGACADPIAGGDHVLFAYATFGEPFLKLTGPAVVNAGTPTAFHVVDNSNQAVAAATINGATTDTAGDAWVTFASPGTYAVKADKSGAVRSNAVAVCVHAGNDGNCGTSVAPPPPAVPGSGPAPVAPPVIASKPAPDMTAPVASISGINPGEVFAAGKGPRELSGTVGEPAPASRIALRPDPSGISRVKLRLSRRDGKKCWSYSGKRERFVGSRCGVSHASFFTIGKTARWSYLLPKRLTRGRYVLEVAAIDKSGNRGQRHVSFRVR